MKGLGKELCVPIAFEIVGDWIVGISGRNRKFLHYPMSFSFLASVMKINTVKH